MASRAKKKVAYKTTYSIDQVLSNIMKGENLIIGKMAIAHDEYARRCITAYTLYSSQQTENRKTSLVNAYTSWKKRYTKTQSRGVDNG